MDPYKILGISPDSTEEQIKKAYKNLAKKHHPDKGGTAEKFREISDAYKKIMHGEDPMESFPEFAELFKMFGMFGLGINGNMHEMGNIMNIIGAPNQYTKGPAINIRIDITLEALELGGNYTTKYLRKVGTGKMIQSVMNGPFGQMVMMIPEEIDKEFEVSFNIPPCFDESKLLILEGLAKADNLPPSDLVVQLNLLKHPRFTRVTGTLDLVTELEVSLKEALTGFKRELLMLNQEKPDIIEVGSIVDPYSSKRIEGYGMRTGDLLVKFKIQFPEIISEETKQIILGLEDL